MDGVAEWAYAAGFFDGEGCIMGNGACSIVVKVSQKDSRPVRWLGSLFGGKVTQREMKGPRRIWVWQLHSKAEVLTFLEGILEYTILKRAQVIVALEVLSLTKGSGYRYSIEERQVIMSKVKVLRELKSQWQ